MTPAGMVERVVSAWREAGVTLNPGATSEELSALEDRLGVPLPADVRAFFTLANGMPDGEVDEHMVHFWPIEKILRESPRDGPPAQPLAIADVMIHSWLIGLHATDAGTVAVVSVPPNFALPSLTLFFETYERDPDALGLLNERKRPSAR